MKVLKFSASWCGPCAILAKTLAGMETPVDILSFDVDIDLEETTRYGVRGVPTMILVTDDGEEIRRITGSQTKEKILEFMEV